MSKISIDTVIDMILSVVIMRILGCRHWLRVTAWFEVLYLLLKNRIAIAKKILIPFESGVLRY